MIAKLKGLVEATGADWAVIDVQGVGYYVMCSSRTLSRLPRVGEAVALLIETQWREDGPHLYAFFETAERDWFRLLTSVQGVGAKLGLAILCTLGPDDLARAIAAQDKAALARASGVGPKLAQRIVMELKDKVAAISLAALPSQAAGQPIKLSDDKGPAPDAVSALVNLGYGRSEAFAAVARAQTQLGEGAKLDALIRQALKDLAA